MSEHDYRHWHDSLDGLNPVINQNEPQPGFWRLKNGSPVAIWFADDGQLTMMVNHTTIGANDYEDIWTRCCTRAVDEDAYLAVMEGGSWPDVDPVVDETLGDNIKNARDINALVEMLRSLAQAANSYETIDSDEAAARAQSIRTRALELRKRADDLRAAEKKPHLEAGQQVDKAWQPLIKSGQATADQLRASIALWENKKRKEREAAEAPAEPIANVRGGYGRAASVRKVKKVVGVDAMQLIPWLREHDGETLDRFLMERAQRFVTEAFTPPGVLTTETVEVR
jgi:hypothetical protein